MHNPDAAKTFIILGALSAAAAIGLGAFGAHALRATLTPRMLDIYHTAVFYHLTHSLGLLAVAFVCSLKPQSGLARAAGWGRPCLWSTVRRVRASITSAPSSWRTFSAFLAPTSHASPRFSLSQARVSAC